MIFILISLIWVPIFNFNIPKPDSQIKVISWNLGLLLGKRSNRILEGKMWKFREKKKNKKMQNFPLLRTTRKGAELGARGGDGPTRPASGLKVKRAPPGRGVGGGTTSGGRPPSDLKPIWRLLDCLRPTGPDPAVTRRKRGHRGTRGTSPIQSQTYENKRRSER